MTKQLFCITLLCLICLSIPVTATAQVVFIPDFDLRAVIEDHLGKVPGATITVADMAWLTELDATNSNIRDLTGLEAATNLIWLWLGNNYISDISPLAGLTKLTQLELDNNFISNISPLARLTRLIYLNLLNNAISDISTVARLTNLTILDLGNNFISNISAIAGLTDLAELWIDNNSISDLWFLVANTGLRGGDEVDVRGNPLSTLSFNTYIPTLQSRGVVVEFDNIVVPTVNIPDPNLRNAIEQVLGKAPSATITTDEMVQLIGLNATSENITNLTGLEHATNLTELGLARNNITDISPLAGLTNLTVLGLARNSITNISPLAGLTNLTALGLGLNNITDISPLAGLTKLTILWLPDNSISDLWPLVANTGLRNGDEVSVKGNPLSALSFNTYIPTLQSRGVTVEFDNIVVPPQAVNIPDPNLRFALEQVLGKARGATITVADMATLKGLSAISENINILTGLEHATNLEELDLRDNFISDISALAGLTNLTLLDFRDNFISNISPLARLTNLTGLGLGNNSISNISALAGLTNLTHLNLRDNSISDISPLARLTNLIGLKLEGNSISNISPLARLTQLTELHLQNNSISDISPLVENTGLRNGDTVDVRGNPLSALSFNTHIPILLSRGVTVEFDNIVVPPQTVNIPDPNLRNGLEQVFHKAPGATITVADMATLGTLYAISENIRNLTGLEHATNLTELGLADNSISDLSALAGLTRLTYLDLRDNFISNISSLARLTNLTALGLGINTISNISPLAGLTNLTHLNLGDNSISDISPLARLTNLIALRLDDNSISNISPLAGLTRLTELYLKNNSISDISPLVANTGLGSGDKVTVTGNPLGAPAYNIHIPILLSRGVNIEFDGTVSPTVNIPDPNLRNALEQVLGKAQGAIITAADMATLDALYATSENITNLTGLEHATNLTELGLVDNNITDISPLAGLTKLRLLWLDNNSISDIFAIAGLTNLSELRLLNNAISDISPLVRNAGLGSADWIDLRGNFLNNASINTHIPTLQSRGIVVEFDEIVVPPKTVDIPSPNLRNAIAQALGKAPGATITAADMATLGALSATNKNIISLTGLESAINLTELGFRDNRISDLSPLAGLTKLTTLDLRDNSISDISPLARLTNLTTLRLGQNNVTHISSLTGSTKLTILDLRNNSISDLSPLVTNTGLGSGGWIDVRGNFLNNTSINTHIPTLQSRGVTVEFDEIVVPPNTVNIPDPNLRAVIEDHLGKARGTTITVADMETVVALSATNKNITNLTGLETATNLQNLMLVGNNITDLSPLARLTRLRRLDLASSSISDISLLAGLPKLGYLNLEDNSISDISPLAGLTQLGYLNLEDNSISDISPLVENTRLGDGDEVYIKGNPLSVLSFNTHIPTLQSRGVIVVFDEIVVPPKTVNIPDPNLRNAIEQVLGKARGATITVPDMETLDVLDATNKNIADLTGLEHAINLTELVLRNNLISDLWPLVANTGLRNGDKVNVKGNPLSDLSINTHIPTLQSRGVTVEFDDIVVPPKTVNIPDPNLRNAIEQALGKAQGATITVAEMEALDVFSAINKNITNLTGLEAATQLTILDLRDNSISDISPLAGLTNLTVLRFARNDITNVSPLAGLTNLTVLNLRDNLVSDISAIAGLTNLTVLRLDINSISNISSLVRLTKLTQLYLGSNSISDLSSLVANTGLGNGDKVIVKGNPLNALSINTHIPTLQSRGVNVEFDDIVVQTEDVNGDGSVNILDLVLVASEFGNEGQNLAGDVNGDGVVNIVDLVLISRIIAGGAAAPSAQPQGTLTAAAVRQWLTDAKALEVRDPIMKRGIVVLQQLLISLTPTETKLLPNYPNPFNPETWIPYRLAEDAFVTLTIYDQTGQAVRTLDVGHQTAAVYESRSKAIYWDGKNEVGETVASGVYFYHLSAGDYSATRKMLILK